MSCKKISGAFAAMRAMMTPDTGVPEERLTTADRAIYALIVFRANGDRACYKSHDEIMADLPSIKTRQTVSASVQKLVGLKYIEVKRQRYGPNYYTILDPAGRLYGPAEPDLWTPSWLDGEDNGGKETIHRADDDADERFSEIHTPQGDDVGAGHVKNSAHQDVKESVHQDVKKSVHQEGTPKVHPSTPKTPSGNARARARGATIPDDWKPGTKSIALGVSLGLTVERVSLEADAMRDWAIDAGKLGRDWDRRFDNWLREEAKRDQRRGGGRHRNGTDGTLGVYDTIRRDLNLPTFLAPDLDDEPPSGQERLQ